MSGDVDDGPKRCRPDRAAALASRKTEVERVVKCALAKRLLQKSLKQPIVDRCRSVSQATHRAGLMFLDIVTKFVAELRRGGEPSAPFPPIFDDKHSLTFFRRLLTGDKKEPRVAESLNTTFAGFPEPTRYPGDGQLYTYAAKSVQTNVRNIVTEAFRDRQIRYVKSWCRQRSVRQGTWFAIIKRINDWGIQEELSLEAEAFAAVERHLLGSPETLSTKWLKEHPDKVFEAYARWLTALEVADEKGFVLTPQFRVKTHNITLDTDALYGIMKAEGLYRGNDQTFRADRDAQWSSVFDTAGLASGKWSFTGMVETDGVACSVHFKRSRTGAEVDASAKAARDKDARKQATLERKRARERSPDRVRAEQAARRKEMAAERAARKKDSGPVPSPGDKRELPEGTLAEDPGVSPNVTYTTHIVGGKRKRRRFTVGRYYTEGGVKRLQKRTTAWQSTIQAAQDTVDAHSLKSTDTRALVAHVDAFLDAYDTLWGEKTKPRWARGRFDTYVRKPKAVDAFYAEVRRDGPVTKHYFGNASFRPTYKGCVPAPKTLVTRRSKMAFPDAPFDMIDEYLTSQCCWRCHQRTRPVATKDLEGKTRTVRGLVFCDSRTCGCFTNRDFQGSHNIGICGAYPRPKLMDRQTTTGKRRHDVKVIPRKSVNAVCEVRPGLPRIG